MKKKVKNDKKIIAMMISVVVVALIFIIVIPVVLYKHSAHNRAANNANLVKDNNIESDPNNPANVDTSLLIQQEQQIEQDIQDIQESGQELDAFYPLILQQIEEQKQLPTIVIPKNYMPRDNYISNAADSRGKIHIFNKNPIMIYVPEGEYYNPISQAFMSYNYIFKGLFYFKSTRYPEYADIVVSIVDSLDDDTDKNAIGLSTVTAYDENHNIKTTEIKILNHGYYDPTHKTTLIEAYNITLHEIGHSLGILGHSQNKEDILYGGGQNDDDTLAVLSERDIETIKIMYSKRQDLIEKQLNNVYSTKLKEDILYAQKSNSSDAYLDLADTYYYAKQYDKAYESYLKALKLNPNNPNIYIKLSACYLVAQKYDDAITYANMALQKAKTADDKTYANYYIATAYDEKEEYDDALPYKYNALLNKPNDKDLFISYIQSCESLGKRKEANKTYNKFAQNFSMSDFSEEEQQLIKWASKPF